MLSTLSLPASDPSLAPAPDRAPLPLRARQAERLAEMLEAWQFPEPIYVTRPTLPSLADYTRQLEAIWESHKLTNNGPLHRRLEEALTRRLGVEHLSLTCNGTIALLIALQALRINGGEIIVTPFTYPPTVHVLYWLQVKPVFCDIDPLTWTIDPARIEALITPETRAIMGVHVYGRPCAVDEIQAIADRHGLHVIYDAAQAFGVEVDGRSVLRWGDMSTLSFHATKLYSTIEGGAIVTNTPERKQRVDFLKNFGIADEETVIGPGINGKLNEMQAAYGLLRLDDVDREIERRRELTAIYRRELDRVPGLTLLPDQPGVRHNFAYLPVLVDPEACGLSRDRLYDLLKEFNVHARKYFHPLCSSYPCYRGLPTARPDHLPVATRIASHVLCLPLYGTLAPEEAGRICAIIRGLIELTA